MYIIITMLLFQILAFLSLNLTFAVSLTLDGLSLLSLKSAVQPTKAAVFSNWNQNDTTPCNWSGVSCANVNGSDYNPRVIGLVLSGNNLRGYIPSELAALVYLRRLNLHANYFYGSIPDQLFNVTSSLRSVFLHGNNLSGPLPLSLCNPPRLQNLDLSRNSLSGGFPGFFKNCKQLRKLVLAGNAFSGDISKGIFPGLANLQQLDLSDNTFSGLIPGDVGELKSLSGTLNFSFNHFTGRMPNGLGDLPLTVRFDLRNNNLSGEIPQLGSFANQGPMAFLNNPLLCGFPLKKTCEAGFVNASGVQSGLAVKSPDRGKGYLKPGLIILISVANAMGIAFIGLLLVYVYWRRKDSSGCNTCSGKRNLGGSNENPSLCSFSCFHGSPTELEEEIDGGVMSGGEGELVAIDKGFNCELDELLKASAYVLGKSRLGIVYKVVLGDGVPVAVRRLGDGGQQRYKEFVAEVQAIAKVKHPNIVKLRAYYWASDEKLLISDYISNGSLASVLRGKTAQPSALSWSTRLKIAKESAQGLAFIHECSPRKFIHGSIKPSNILLDTVFCPYISDFGLNKLISITGVDPSSSSEGGFIVGPISYLKPGQFEKANYYGAPEARVFGAQPSQKWDVYSFGVVLLELLTGKSPVQLGQVPGMEIPDLVNWVRKVFDDDGPLSEVVDPTLLLELHAEKEIVPVFRVALLCTEDDPEMRPKMKAVAENLEKVGI